MAHVRTLVERRQAGQQQRRERLGDWAGRAARQVALVPPVPRARRAPARLRGTRRALPPDDGTSYRLNVD